MKHSSILSSTRITIWVKSHEVLCISRSGISVYFKLLIFDLLCSIPKHLLWDHGRFNRLDHSTCLERRHTQYIHSSNSLVKENITTISASVTLGASKDTIDDQQQLISAVVFSPMKSPFEFCHKLHVEFNEAENAWNYLFRAPFPSSNLSLAGDNIVDKSLPSTLGTRLYYFVDSTFITFDLDPKIIELFLSRLEETVSLVPANVVSGCVSGCIPEITFMSCNSVTWSCGTLLQRSKSKSENSAHSPATLRQAL